MNNIKDCCFCNNMKIKYAFFMDFISNRIKSFEILDWGIFKLCLFTIGLIIGGFNSKCIKKNVVVITIVAVLSYLYLIFKLFIEEE